MIQMFHADERDRRGEEGMGKGNKKGETSPITRSPDERRKKEIFLCVLIIVFLTLAFYSSVFRAGFIWDDDDYVTENINLRTLRGLGNIWFKFGATPQYYPLAHTSFWMEYHVWGARAFGYHLTNILLHGLNAVLVWFVLRKLKMGAALPAALVFALHPVHVESVAWITERKNVLSGFFYLCSLLFYLHHANINAPPALQQTNKRKMFYVLSLAFYIFALLSKTVAASLPVAILIILWWKRNRISLKNLKSLVPFFAAGIILGLITIWMEKSNVGAKGKEWDISLVERCLIGGRAIWFYMGKIVFPYKLCFIYPRWDIDAMAGWQYLFPLAVIMVLVFLGMTRKSMGKGALAAVVYFIVTLFPALGFFNIYPMLFSYVADHFQYLASIGMIVLLCSGIKRLGERINQHFVYGMFGGIILVLGILTFRQGMIYKDAESLWRDTLARNPHSWMPHNNLGMALASRGRLDEAIYHYTEGIRLKPDDAVGHYNLATVLDEKGETGKAMEHYQKAILLNPLYPDAYTNLGADLILEQRWDEALKYLKKAVELNPRHIKALDNMGVVFSKMGKMDEALGYYQKAVEIDPNYYEGYYNMAVAYGKKGNPAKAVEYYEKTLGIFPGLWEAHYNLGLSLVGLNQDDRAIVHFQKALEKNPELVEAHLDLAELFMKKGKAKEAEKHYEAAVRLNPNNERAGKIGEMLSRQREITK